MNTSLEDPEHGPADGAPCDDVVAAAARRRAALHDLMRARAEVRAAEDSAAAARRRFQDATAHLSAVSVAARRRGSSAADLGRRVGLSRQRISQLTAV